MKHRNSTLPTSSIILAWLICSAVPLTNPRPFDANATDAYVFKRRLATSFEARQAIAAAASPHLASDLAENNITLNAVGAIFPRGSGFISAVKSVWIRDKFAPLFLFSGTTSQATLEQLIM